MKEKIRAQQNAILFFEEQASIPAVRQMRRSDKTHPMATNYQYFTITKGACGPDDKIADSYYRAHKTADSRRSRSRIKPSAQSAAFV